METWRRGQLSCHPVPTISHLPHFPRRNREEILTYRMLNIVVELSLNKTVAAALLVSSA